MTTKPVLHCPVSIVLVGMMGVGKTTVGRRLAPRIGLPFYDADDEIVRAAGMSVSDLFRDHGESHFRQGEAQVIKRLLSGPPIVLADTRKIINSSSLSIWLKAPIDVIVERATRRNTRPLLKDGDPKEIIGRLLIERMPFYETARGQIDTGNGTHAKTVNAIIKLIRKNLANKTPLNSTQKKTPASP